MQLINYNKNPVNILVSKNFPGITRINEDVALDEELEKMTKKIASNFQKDTKGNTINPNGKIPGWDGEYLSASKQFMDFVRESILNSENELVQISKLKNIDANVVKVSKNLASEYFNMTAYGHNHYNKIAPIGIYIVPLIFDKESPLMIFDRRPSDAFFDPGRLNSISKALTVSESDNYLESSVEALNKKYNIQIDINKITPIGMTSDNVHNITHPFGFARISLEQARDYDKNKINAIVPVESMPEFLKRNPIETWTYTGFAAAYATAVFGLKNNKSYNKIIDSFKNEFNKLKEQPVHELSSVELIGLNPF